MPQQLQRLRAIAGDDLDTCIVLDEIAKVPQDAVDPDGERLAGANVARPGGYLGTADRRAVGLDAVRQRDPDQENSPARRLYP